MEYPAVVDVSKVGTFPAFCFAGGGYFFDEVLEYRVWFHGKDGKDYFIPCESFEMADMLSKNPQSCGIPEGDRVEEPLALIRQLEWINESEPGVYEHKTGERITEWQVGWLDRGPRTPGAIEKFLTDPLRRN